MEEGKRQGPKCWRVLGGAGFVEYKLACKVPRTFVGETVIFGSRKGSDAHIGTHTHACMRTRMC
eukprot:6173330-Pleurochrysis_carterae.AAC.5